MLLVRCCTIIGVLDVVTTVCHVVVHMQPITMGQVGVGQTYSDLR